MQHLKKNPMNSCRANSWGFSKEGFGECSSEETLAFRGLMFKPTQAHEFCHFNGTLTDELPQASTN